MKILWLNVALAVSIGSVIYSPVAHGRTWYVNEEGTGDAPTIAAALDSCAAGDSVLVGAGYYRIESNLMVGERVTVVSESGAEATVLERAATPVICMICSDSVVEGFTLSSISISDGEPFQSGGRISKNIFRGSGDPLERAMLFWLCSGVTISENCIIDFGNGIVLQESSGFTFYRNTIMACGTAITLDGSYPWNTLRNNLVVGNGYGINLGGGVIGDISCNDVFGNSIANYAQGTDPTGTNGNISIDPLFCAVDPPSSGNFLLRSDSPCAPGNHPDEAECGLIGAGPVGCDETSVEQTSWGAIKSIFR